MSNICSTCKWFAEAQAGETTAGNTVTHVSENCGFGRCHYNPPTEKGFPEVSGSNFCSHYCEELNDE